MRTRTGSIALTSLSLVALSFGASAQTRTPAAPHVHPHLTASPVPAASSAPANTSRETMLLDPNNAPESLRITLPGVANGVIAQESAFGGMGCTGQNRAPRITWSGAPAGTRSFVIVVHDPDAPTGVGFFHWLVANLPATTTELPLGGALPAGAMQTQTDFGMAGYGGPCPPPGENHRYVFTVYALDVPRLELAPTASGALIRFMVRGHTLALGRAVATYRRP